MKVLSIIAQKGGVGKTTLATCLAVEADKRGKRVLLIDLDPQATASFWGDVRQKPDNPAIMSIPPARLSAVLKAAESADTDLVVIDGAAVSKDIAFASAEVADFILVPFKASVFDINSVAQTVQLLKKVNAPYSLILTFVPPQGREIAEAKEIAESLDSPLCPIMVGNRKAYFRAQSSGLAVQEFEPSSKAASEIESVYTYTCIQLGMNDEGEQYVQKLA